jgi:glutamate-1-semialdehyde 2,1-aminomutase
VGTVLVPLNDPAALAAALERRDIAIVLTEPALTNNFGLILPDPGFHAELRRLTRETGTLLAIDETHTQVVGAGGLTPRGAWTPTSSPAASRSPGACPSGRGA